MSCSTRTILNQELDELLEKLQVSAIDQIFFDLAICAMTLGGHRYGAYLDAATTAAKLAIYKSYLMTGKSFRKTGMLYHIEPKRVKAILREVEATLQAGKSLKTLGGQEPQYLIRLPYLWLENYPWCPGHPRLQHRGLTPGERQQIEANLPSNLPNALMIDEGQLTDLLEQLHKQSQKSLLVDQQMSFSTALAEHIKFRLLHSGTIIQVDVAQFNVAFYLLACKFYSPSGKVARSYTMIQDVARFFQLMQGWVQEQPGVLRALEVFDIDPEEKEEALK